MTLSRAHQLFQKGFYSIGISSFHRVFSNKKKVTIQVSEKSVQSNNVEKNFRENFQVLPRYGSIDQEPSFSLKQLSQGMILAIYIFLNNVNPFFFFLAPHFLYLYIILYG